MERFIKNILLNSEEADCFASFESAMTQLMDLLGLKGCGEAAPCTPAFLIFQPVIAKKDAGRLKQSVVLKQIAELYTATINN